MARASWAVPALPRGARPTRRAVGERIAVATFTGGRDFYQAGRARREIGRERRAHLDPVAALSDEEARLVLHDLRAARSAGPEPVGEWSELARRRAPPPPRPPCTSMLTPPRSFRTQPVSPNSRATRNVKGRKPTPCTLPVTFRERRIMRPHDERSQSHTISSRSQGLLTDTDWRRTPPGTGFYPPPAPA